MNLLIIEPDAGGHHMSPYVQFLVRETVRRGWKVRLMTTRKSASHPALTIVENEMPGALALSFMPEITKTGGTGPMSLFREQIQYRKAMASGFNELRPDEVPDLVVVMSLDSVDKALSVFGSPFGDIPFSGIFVSVKFHRFEMGIGPTSGHDKLYKWSFERLLSIKSFWSVTVIDEYFVEYSQQQSKSEYGKVKFVPDPGELEGSGSVAHARDHLAIPYDRFVILVYGSLTRRKGIKELFDAVSLLKEEESISVLLAGQIDEGVQAILSQPMAVRLLADGRLFVVPGYQGAEQEYGLFRSADAVWLGYVDGFYGKSAVMAQAGTVGLPVLASNVGLIGSITRSNDLGLVCNPENTSAVAAEIRRLKSDRQLQKRLGENGRRFAQQSTAEKYGNALCAAIDLRLEMKIRNMLMKKDSKIFVAGHRGLVGSAIVKNLVSQDYNNVLTADHSALDLTVARDVNEYFNARKPEYVFMAAARVGGILANSTHPVEFLRENLLMQTHVIEASYHSDVRKFLFLGSSCIYPKNALQPIKEESLLSGPLESTNEWYAIAKIAGIKLCAAYRQQYGFDAISLMPVNLYGPGDNFNLENAHVLPALIRKFHQAKIGNQSQVVLWGTGTPRREFLYVNDLADAALFFIDHYSDEGILNVGVGKDITIRELAGIIADVVGYEGEIAQDESKPDGVPSKLLDVSRATSMGWVARTSLRDGIEGTYQWFLENQDTFRG